MESLRNSRTVLLALTIVVGLWIAGHLSKSVGITISHAAADPKRSWCLQFSAVSGHLEVAYGAGLTGGRKGVYPGRWFRPNLDRHRVVGLFGLGFSYLSRTRVAGDMIEMPFGAIFVPCYLIVTVLVALLAWRSLRQGPKRHLPGFSVESGNRGTERKRERSPI
jgi:hypothetical protein